MININSLRFLYHKESFELSIPKLSIAPLKKTAIIGPSGSGKTTLLKLISGILVPQEGIIHIDNLYVNELSDAQRRAFRIKSIGFIFQDFELLEYLNILDNILHPYRITKALTLTNNTRSRARELAEKLKIDDKLYNKPNELSQGERQRAAICRALLPNPKLILADEATGNLDPQNKIRILDQLIDCVEEHNATLIAVTHDRELLPYFDHVVDFQEFYKTEVT
ncbi:MAG: ATP-binding cassette domain-containing protein [Gammaproteobacteria bacterium]|nr:ATP-binding cassette domain-containing protein [Gammaproteobacteria bacterium]